MAVPISVTETKSLTSRISNWQVAATIYKLLLGFTSVGQDCGEVRGPSHGSCGQWEDDHGGKCPPQAHAFNQCLFMSCCYVGRFLEPRDGGLASRMIWS